ncbi:MAG TPA: hypothetical protein VK922_12435 [Gemmatimonadaceae bacterium]|nr:hypothetical protein [Gemmatimonadaceae bacterium]
MPDLLPVPTLADAVSAYRETGDIVRLLDHIADLAHRTPTDALRAAAEPFRDIPEVIGPVYEHVVADSPDDAGALVTLANAYWLAGRGPEAVGELAARAIAADPSHRGAWHLWALSESDARSRTERWRQVTERFPEDELARVLLADNAASLAGAESDADALALAIRTYESLRTTASGDQRAALDRAIATLRGWSL